MTDFERMMQELQTEYISELPDRIEEIRQHGQDQDFNLLQDDFHKLKGTGKTYGIPEISQLCQIMEQLCIHNTKLALKLLPAATEVLQDIQKSRTDNHPFSLSQDSRYQKIEEVQKAENIQLTAL